MPRASSANRPSHRTRRSVKALEITIADQQADSQRILQTHRREGGGVPTNQLQIARIQRGTKPRSAPGRRPA
jgi:hypothetical protein